MTPVATAPARTRRSQITRAAILAGAADRFAAVGYSDASMDDIASAAGVTKPTVYAHFGSKDRLFTELLQSVLDGLDELSPAHVTTSDQLVDALTSYAGQRIDTMLGEQTLGLLRAASAEGIRRPDWAMALIGSLSTSRFEAWLATVAEAALLNIGSPSEVAELFWGQIEGALFFPTLVGMVPLPSAARRNRIIAASVQQFLATYRPKATSERTSP